MPSLQDKAWVWGYVVAGSIPGKVPWAPNDKSGCSLETDAGYVCGADGDGQGWRTIALDGPDIHEYRQ